MLIEELQLFLKIMADDKGNITIKGLKTGNKEPAPVRSEMVLHIHHWISVYHMNVSNGMDDRYQNFSLVADFDTRWT